MTSRGDLSELIDGVRLAQLRSMGALVLDVDDTLLARERADGAGQETFDESATAAVLPELLQRGFNLCLITGHGWRQLDSRLVSPIVCRLRQSGDEEQLERLGIYANRGATRITWDGTRHTVDEIYGEDHQLRASDVAGLRGLLETLRAEFEIDFRERSELYREAFPRFDFDTPALVTEREGAVLVLRPVPGHIHAAAGQSDAEARSKLYQRGLELLEHTGFGNDYQLAKSGRSSIEITRRSVSKGAAMRDLINRLAALSGASLRSVEESVVYVGDEFFPGGNDCVIPELFPRVLCLSVAGDPLGQETLADVRRFTDVTGEQGTAAALGLLTHLRNLSARV